jgi:hypothetical protein
MMHGSTETSPDSFEKPRITTTPDGRLYALSASRTHDRTARRELIVYLVLYLTLRTTRDSWQKRLQHTTHSGDQGNRQVAVEKLDVIPEMDKILRLFARLFLFHAAKQLQWLVHSRLLVMAGYYVGLHMQAMHHLGINDIFVTFCMAKQIFMTSRRHCITR